MAARMCKKKLYFQFAIPVGNFFANEKITMVNFSHMKKSPSYVLVHPRMWQGNFFTIEKITTVNFSHSKKLGAQCAGKIYTFNSPHTRV